MEHKNNNNLVYPWVGVGVPLVEGAEYASGWDAVTDPATLTFSAFDGEAYTENEKPYANFYFNAGNATKKTAHIVVRTGAADAYTYYNYTIGLNSVQVGHTPGDDGACTVCGYVPTVDLMSKIDSQMTDFCTKYYNQFGSKDFIGDNGITVRDGYTDKSSGFDSTLAYVDLGEVDLSSLTEVTLNGSALGLASNAEAKSLSVGMNAWMYAYKAKLTNEHHLYVFLPTLIMAANDNGVVKVVATGDKTVALDAKLFNFPEDNNLSIKDTTVRADRATVTTAQQSGSTMTIKATATGANPLLGWDFYAANDTKVSTSTPIFRENGSGYGIVSGSDTVASTTVSYAVYPSVWVDDGSNPENIPATIFNFVIPGTGKATCEIELVAPAPAPAE